MSSQGKSAHKSCCVDGKPLVWDLHTLLWEPGLLSQWRTDESLPALIYVLVLLRACWPGSLCLSSVSSWSVLGNNRCLWPRQHSATLGPERALCWGLEDRHLIPRTWCLLSKVVMAPTEMLSALMQGTFPLISEMSPWAECKDSLQAALSCNLCSVHTLASQAVTAVTDVRRWRVAFSHCLWAELFKKPTVLTSLFPFLWLLWLQTRCATAQLILTHTEVGILASAQMTSLFYFLLPPDDEEWHSGVWRSEHSDSRWHFRRRYWFRQHRSRRILLPTTPAHKKTESPAACLWSEEDWRGRKTRAASHPPVSGRLWLRLQSVLWSGNMYLQPGRH